MKDNNYLMPAEWEPHAATWIAWPHEETDWPGKLPAIYWVYAEIVRGLATSETVNVLCNSEQDRELAEEMIFKHHPHKEHVKLYRAHTDRSWLRDSMPIAARNQTSEATEWISWNFSAWAKYENFSADKLLYQEVKKISGKNIVEATSEKLGGKISLEGGSIDVDGLGTLMTTEECLLSEVQERNPGFGRADYEAVFSQYLGATRTIWLGRGCVGDDTHGHIDDIARFVAPGRVLLAYEDDPQDENHQASADNLRRLEQAVDSRGEKLHVTKLPMPRPVWCGEERLPASYANFYIANKVVLVPTFNCEQDRRALNIIAEAFPTRKIIGIHAVDLVLGQGTLHCLSQQEPA